jgi:hypothetical protein
VCCACVRCDESTSMVRKDVETFNVFFWKVGESNERLYCCWWCMLKSKFCR